jgi:hypothetical protein
MPRRAAKNDDYRKAMPGGKGHLRKSMCFVELYGTPYGLGFTKLTVAPLMTN